MTIIDRDLLRSKPLPVHADDDDKNARGRVLVVGGSRQVPGGVLLASVAALRAGAGKLQIATVESVAVAMGLAVPEALVLGCPEMPDGEIAPDAALLLAARIDGCDALLVGPGMMGTSAGMLAAALAEVECGAALVLDAGGLQCPHDVIAARRGQPVLTPHAGEMAQLLGIDRAAVVANPEGIARDAAARLDSIVVLKGGTTLVATPDGTLLHYEGGGVGLATSGSGDTLAGIITGLLARGTDPIAAAAWGVWLHGEAGDRLAKSFGRIGFLARELLAEVPRVMASFDENCC